MKSSIAHASKSDPASLPEIKLVPIPRNGIQGSWDKFIGPGASWSEQLVALLPALAFTLVVVAMAWYQQADWYIGTYLVAALLACDMVGGIATTATLAARRWYHKAGQSTAQHLKFIVPHTAHLALFAWLFVEDSLLFFAVFTFWLVPGSLAIMSAPLNIQRSVAHLLVFGAVVLGLQFNMDMQMQWFIPALFIKLFVSYLPLNETSQEKSGVISTHEENKA